MLKKRRYIGISYPKLLANPIAWWLWKRTMCKRGRHLLDELWSPDDWYLYCDACGLMVHIDRVENENNGKTQSETSGL